MAQCCTVAVSSLAVILTIASTHCAYPQRIGLGDANTFVKRALCNERHPKHGYTVTAIINPIVSVGCWPKYCWMIQQQATSVFRPSVSHVPDMTYNVFGGMLNLTQSINQPSVSILYIIGIYTVAAWSSSAVSPKGHVQHHGLIIPGPEGQVIKGFIKLLKQWFVLKIVSNVLNCYQVLYLMK